MFEETFERNVAYLSEDKNYVELLNKVNSVRQFFENYSFLQFGRNFEILSLLGKKFSSHSVLQSIEQTLYSIENCCKIGSLSDTYILLRKYRDDLFFYLYITVVSNEQKMAIEEAIQNNECRKDEKREKAVRNIDSWTEDKLNALHISEVLKYVGQSSQLAEAVSRYNLHSSFENIGKKLNDFVHANGVSFYNKLYPQYSEGEFERVCKDIIDILNYITTIFVFLSALCKPLSIMSHDYVDYLDCGETPPIESEYWVPPFIIEFFQTKAHYLDESCMKYLQDETNMQLLGN
ncbi:MAG: hypothetical protein FWD84_03875 [Oscillospiraceae bacterium]|nr:hypothetical protein [Oscillospiraceae bacterium]